MFFGQQINFASRDPKIKVDLHKMTEGRQDATIMVAYLAQKERTEEALLAATAKADRLLNDRAYGGHELHGRRHCLYSDRLVSFEAVWKEGDYAGYRKWICHW